MIAFLNGKLQEKNELGVIIDVSGVGYELLLSSNSLPKVPKVGEDVGLHVYLHVREDTMKLFGFYTLEEKELFTHLISVNGVGPKVALSILSTFSAPRLKQAIATEDIDLITTVPGIGKKNAQRLIIELKTKLDLPEMDEILGVKDEKTMSVYKDAREALLNLGYSTTEASRALEGFASDGEELTTEEMVKYALKNLAST